ncbi:hypothetical protein ABE420_02125 [Rahnella bonaserana]|nr:hypothetical protein [Rahnella variigena]
MNAMTTVSPLAGALSKILLLLISDLYLEKTSSAAVRNGHPSQRKFSCVTGMTFGQPQRDLLKSSDEVADEFSS